VESVTGTPACSAPLAALTCGSETYNSGDFITGLMAGNAVWKQLDGASGVSRTISGKVVFRPK
jgi:hypothetical protein